MMRRREKVFGPGRTVPLDRNQKARIQAYARAWDASTASRAQRGGALGRAALDVLGALLWAFHNARSGCCFPSYERIAERAGCARSTVAEAIKVLEWAGVLTWQNRIVRVRERCRDLWGREGWRWRVIRTSNAYVFRDPKAAEQAGIPSKSDQRTGTPNQEIKTPVQALAIDPASPGLLIAVQRDLLAGAEDLFSAAVDRHANGSPSVMPKGLRLGRGHALPYAQKSA